jgi:hypothetical protein
MIADPSSPKFFVPCVGQSISGLMSTIESKQILNLPSSMIYSGDREYTSLLDGKSLQWFEREVAGLQLIFLVVDFSDDDARDLYPQMVQMAIEQSCFVLVFPASGRITGKISIRGLMDQGVFIVEQARHPFASPADIVVNGIQAISDICNVPHIIGVDYDDIRHILKNCCGYTFLSQGEGASCLEAAGEAIACFRESGVDLQNVKGIIIGVTVGELPPLNSVSVGLNLIQEAAHEDAEIIFGMLDDPSLGTNVRVSVFAFGFDSRRLTES